MKNLDHRVRSGWQDGLRQLGVRVLPEHTLTTGVPEGLRYAALWMVKRRKDGPTRLPRHTPVAVMVTPLAPGTGLAAVTGWDPKAAQWIPYPQFLLKLVKIAEIPDIDDDLEAEAPGNDAVPATPQAGQSGAAAGSRRPVTYRVWKQNMDEQRRETERYLQKMLRSLRGHPTVLLTHSQNSRMHWPWLQDGQTEQDLIKTGHAPAVPPRSRPALDPGTQHYRTRNTAVVGQRSPWRGKRPAARDVDRDRRRGIHLRPDLLQHHRQSRHLPRLRSRGRQARAPPTPRRALIRASQPSTPISPHGTRAWSRLPS